MKCLYNAAATRNKDRAKPDTLKGVGILTARAKILFVTTGLESGGAEMSLYKLVTRMDKSRFDCSVVSLTDAGPVLGARIQEGGIPLHCLGFARGMPDPRMVTSLARWIGKAKPDLVQTWMYHADLVGGLAAGLARRPAARRAPVVWSVHSTHLVKGKNKSLTLGVIGLNARLSRRLPARVLCCSDAARDTHLQLGYPETLLLTIPSGVDTEEFIPNPAARADVRQELHLPPDAPLIGLSARFDPQKDHETFFRAAQILHRSRPEARFVLWGGGITPDNRTLARMAQGAGVDAQTHFLGLRRDTARLTAALDAATCCSAFGESFALVMGEAMACGIPCVTTDMAGPAAIVGGHGWVVPVRDARALAEAWREMLDLTPEARAARQQDARGHILDHFSLDKTVREYEAFYKTMLQNETADK